LQRIIFSVGKQNIKDQLQKAREEVVQISCSISETKKMLRRIHEQNFRSKVSKVKLFQRFNFQSRIRNELECLYLCEGNIDIS